MSETLTTEQVEEILHGCAGVTPGAWAVFHDTCAHCAKNGTAGYGISGIPGGYHAPFRAKADAAHIARLDPQTVASLVTELLALRKRVGELNRTATDRLYMMEAYHSMLGPTGLEVVKAWTNKGVKRAHFSWGPEARSLTGEERAEAMLEVENATKTLVEFVDDEPRFVSPTPKEPS